MEQSNNLGGVLSRVHEALYRIRSGNYLTERGPGSSGASAGGYENYQMQNVSAYQQQQQYGYNNAYRDREMPGSLRPSTGWNDPLQGMMGSTNRPDQDDRYQGMGRPVSNDSYQGMSRPDSSSLAGNYGSNLSDETRRRVMVIDYMHSSLGNRPDDSCMSRPVPNDSYQGMSRSDSSSLTGNYGSSLRDESRRRVMAMDDMEDSDRGGIKKMKSNFGEAIISAVGGMGIANRLQSRDHHAMESIKQDLGEAVVSAMKNMPSMTESLLMIEEMKNELFQVTHAGFRHSQRLLKREIDSLEGDLVSELDKQKSARYDPNPPNPEPRFDWYATSYQPTASRSSLLSYSSEPNYASSRIQTSYEPQIPRNEPTPFRNPIYRPKNENQRRRKRERERRRSPLPKKSEKLPKKSAPEKKEKQPKEKTQPKSQPEKKKATKPDLPEEVPDEIRWLVFDPYTLPKDCKIPPPKDGKIQPQVDSTGMNPCRGTGPKAKRYSTYSPYSRHFYTSSKKWIQVPLIVQKQKWLRLCKYDPLTPEEWQRTKQCWNQLKENFNDGTLKKVVTISDAEAAKKAESVTSLKTALQNELATGQEKVDSEEKVEARDISWTKEEGSEALEILTKALGSEHETSQEEKELSTTPVTTEINTAVNTQKPESKEVQKPDKNKSTERKESEPEIDLPEEVPTEIRQLVFDPYTLPVECNIPPKAEVQPPTPVPTGPNPFRKLSKEGKMERLATFSPFMRNFYFTKSNVPIPHHVQETKWRELCKHDPLTPDEWKLVLKSWNRLKKSVLDGRMPNIKTSGVKKAQANADSKAVEEAISRAKDTSGDCTAMQVHRVNDLLGENSAEYSVEEMKTLQKFILQ